MFGSGCLPSEGRQVKRLTNVGSNLSRFRRWANRFAEAMSARKRTEITIETDHILVIRRRRSTGFWCAECGREVDVIGWQEAWAFVGKTAPTPTSSPLPDGWHLCTGQAGELLVCVESLLRALRLGNNKNLE